MSIKSTGFDVAGVFVPSFTLLGGTIVLIKWPAKFESKSVILFSKKIKMIQSCNGLYIDSPIEIALPHDKTFLLTTLAKQAISDQFLSWCKERFGFIDTQTKIIDMALTMRFLIAIETASTKEKFVLIHMAGLDPRGEDIIFDYIREKRFKGWAFLILKFPVFQDGLCNKTCVAEVSVLQ